MHSTHNEEKPVVAERLIRTLKNKIYIYMTSVSKNVYIDKLDDIVNKYNNTYHSAIKMKSVNVNLNTYIDSSKEVRDKNPKYEIGDNVKISKHEIVFAKGYTPSWSKEVFVVKKVNTVPWTCGVSDLQGKEIFGMFYGIGFQNTNQKKFRVKKVIKRKGDKFYVK